MNFNPTIKTGCNVADVVSKRIYRGDLRWQYGALVLAGVWCEEIDTHPIGQPFSLQPKEGQVFTAIDILNMDSVDIVADIGKPEFMHKYACFSLMDTITIRKSFLDAILPYNQTWWAQCESLIKHVSIA